MNLKKGLFQFLIPLGSTLLTLLICEVILRMFYPQPVGPVRSQFDKGLLEIYKPNQKGRQSNPGVFDYHFEHNAEGFRITNNQKTGFSKKIALLGDSFTYGFGVDTEYTFAFRLQDSVRRYGVEILNAGHGGRGTDHALKWLQIYGISSEIQEVIYMAYYNDFFDNYRQDFYELKDEALIVKELSPKEHAFFRSDFYSWLRANSHVYSIFRKVVFKLNPKKGNGSDNFVASKERKLAFILTTKYLDAIRKFCIQHNKLFTIYYIPSLVELEYQKRESSPSPFLSLFSEYTAKYNIPFYDFFSDLEKGYEFYYLKEGHWNRKGHHLAAEQLFDDFKNRQRAAK